MSNTIKVQDFYLLDTDKNLPTEDSVVATFKGIISSDSDLHTMQQLLIDNDMKGIIQEHNKKRVGLVNKGILERTGKKVNLEPVTMKNLEWLIK